MVALLVVAAKAPSGWGQRQPRCDLRLVKMSTSLSAPGWSVGPKYVHAVGEGRQREILRLQRHVHVRGMACAYGVCMACAWHVHGSVRHAVPAVS